MPLSSFFFDCLYLEGEGPLVSLPYAERFERLARIVPAGSLLPRIVTGDAGRGRPLPAVRRSRPATRALMAKSLQAPYAAGQRGFHWLKLKSAHTLDLVVLAVEWGSGRRQGWLSNLHLGARDAGERAVRDAGEDVQGADGRDAALADGEAAGPGGSAATTTTVYVRPELVVEIAFSDVQESPRYPGGARAALRAGEAVSAGQAG